MKEIFLSIIVGIFAIIIILSVVAFVILVSCFINVLIEWSHNNEDNKKNM